MKELRWEWRSALFLGVYNSVPLVKISADDNQPLPTKAPIRLKQPSHNATNQRCRQNNNSRHIDEGYFPSGTLKTLVDLSNPITHFIANAANADGGARRVPLQYISSVSWEGNGVLDIGQLAVLGVVGMFLFIWLRNIKHSTSADDKAQNLSGPDIQIRRKKSECIKELTISNERVAFLLRLRRRFGSPIRQRCSGSITQLFNSQNSSHDWWEEQGGGYQPPKEGNALIDLGTQESCYSVAIFLTLAFFASMNYQKRPRPSTVGIKRTVFK